MISIKLARHGIKNTPFYHIVVCQKRAGPSRKPIEKLGTYDPIPDKEGVKAISLNFDRVKYWIGVGAQPSETVARILSKADIIPAKPRPGMTTPAKSTKINTPSAPSTPSA
ncbi:hypothetical protein DFQ27_008190 [Actinomortierella ambigua]|uniref:30S ribosomal protein S16 n=1 Tax=Actinomortierella ambigua TaxID=1343610 RepID=A0A9P6QJ68_9FUNG|nr:hypothetical protein DFQ26_003444 [Actinomortierella ambigua]KAG0267801.1 hypothetical protein DFQ27_008190 [Actinomortierella ambigua]